VHEETSVAPGLSSRRFALIVAGLLGLYLVLQMVYILRLPLVMDEFQGASAVHRLAEEVPYRDFQPYKPVVGYYLQFPVLKVASGIWSGLLLIKGQMALLVAVALAWMAFRLARIYRQGAVLLALALLVSMSTFLERSADLRVDMLTGLAGLVSLVLLVGEPEGRGRWGGAIWGGAIWGGVWAALAFLVSQKGAFFPLAGGAALAAQWLAQRDRPRFRRMVGFGLGGLAVGAAYFAFWFLVVGGNPLADTVAPAQRVLQGVYAIRGRFWLQTLLRNPLFYLLALVSLVGLGRAALRHRGRGEGARPLFLAVYGAVLWGLCLWYEQPWPYFFVLLLPTLTVLHSAWLSEGLRRRDAGGAWFGLKPKVALALALLLGVAYPLLLRVPRVLALDSDFQRYNVALLDTFLEDGGEYLAGVDLLWNRHQAVHRLAWIDAAGNAHLHALAPSEQEAILRELEARPVKVLVWSYRMANLPPSFQAYFNSRFRQVVANLHLYAPLSLPIQERVTLKFSGQYLVDVQGEGECFLDGEPLTRYQRLHLEAGEHANGCTVPLRLTLLPPELETRFDPRFRASRPLFANVYTY